MASFIARATQSLWIQAVTFHKGTAHLMPLRNIHQATPALDSSMGGKAQSVL